MAVAFCAVYEAFVVCFLVWAVFHVFRLYHTWCWVRCWNSCLVRVSSSAISVRIQFWKRASVGLHCRLQCRQNTC